MKIQFSPKDTVKLVVKEVICAYAAANGIDQTSAELLGSAGSGIVGGFSISRNDPTNLQKVNKILKEAILSAVASPDYEIPPACVDQMLSVFSPEKMKSILASSRPQNEFSDSIKMALKASDECDLETLPIKEISEGILESIYKKLHEDTDLMIPILLGSSQINSQKLDALLELLISSKNQIFAGNDSAQIYEGRRMLTKPPVPVTEQQIIHRQADIQEIVGLLHKEPNAVLLSGFGGIGKTSLAQLLFHKLNGEFDEAAWIPYHGTLKDSVLASVQLFEEVKNPYERLTAILHELKNNGRKKLIVIDNADHNEAAAQNPAKDTDLRAITGWSNTTVIVTSRLSQLSGYFSYPVDFLSPDECLELFFHYSDHSRTPENEAAAKDLIELAKCHTFTVELLAKGGNCESGLQEYCITLKDKGFSFPDIEIDTDKDEATATIAEHLKMLFDLQTRTPEQTKLLQCFAVLPVGEKLTKQEIKQWFDFDINTVDPLAKIGWLSGRAGLYAMHPLVKEIILLAPLPKDTCAHYLSFVEDDDNGYFSRTEEYTKTIRKIDIADTILNGICTDRDTLQFGHIYHNLASAYNNMGDYDNALKFYEKALKIREAKLGTDHPDTATTYNNIGLVYDDKGDYDNALKFYEKALQISEAKLGTDHPDTATTYNNIGLVYQAKGDYDNALKFCEKALQIRETKLGTDHPDTATTYNNIGGVYKSKGDYDNALKFYEKALQICEAKLGTDHPDTATTYNNIGLVYKSKGDYDNALKFYEKALQIKEAKLGTDHPDTATTYNNIALVYDDKGDYDNALKFYEKALKIREAKLGTDHPDTATTYNNIGVVYDDKGDYDNALKFYEKALQISEAKLGTDHPDTATTYNNIGLVYDDKGDYDNALKFYEKALQISEAKLGTDHPDTATTYNNIGLVYKSKGDYDNALKFCEKALQIRETKLGTDHPETAITYMNIGTIQYRTGAYQNGLENLRKAYLVFIRKLGKEHSYSEKAFGWLTACYRAAYPDGEPFEEWLQKQLDAGTDE